MKLEAFNLVFPVEYLRAALMVSLLSVWVLVGLFFYLNRFTKRQYFTVWTAAWLFYALWLTLSAEAPTAGTGTSLFMLKQWCISISAVFLLWGSLSFLGLRVPQTLFGLFMLFLMAWSVVSRQMMSSAMEMQLPVFLLIGSGSLFASVSFFRLRKRLPYVGAGMLSLGFLLWGFYLASYPVAQANKELQSAGFFAAAVLQLFIAVSMIVLVLEEVRHKTEQLRVEMEAARSEKQLLQAKVLTTQDECRSLYDQVRLTKGVQVAYEELRRTQAMVVQQERLRALGQMASGVAHDINNALMPIVAYSEMMLNGKADLSEVAVRRLEVIHRCSRDIAHTVMRMREFYRRSEAEKLVKVDVNRIVEETIDMTRPRWRDDAQRQGISIQIERQLDPNLPLLLSEPSELREALTNLIFNSVDALSKGGTITLTTRALKSSATGPATPPSVQIEVKDSGMGMDEEVRTRCLEPFFSTKTHRGGSGLGLAMVYGMIQRHQGSVDIESTPGCGTSFRLTFPPRDAVEQKPAEPAPEAEPVRSLNLLCIDDDEGIRDLLNECLGEFHHRVTVASNGAQGLKLFERALNTKLPYQAVITDLGMPEMDGKQLARNIKAQSAGTPVIMMTGWGTMMVEEGETAPQVDALIGKPPHIGELNTLLHRLCPQD
jgi:signal transduction histidine kinase/CheY-like chemotaxis protein